MQEAIDSGKDRKTIRELKKRAKYLERNENKFTSILNNERDKKEEAIDSPLAIAESFLRLNSFQHAKRLKEAGQDISDHFLREVYQCRRCRKVVGRETGGEKYCSNCNSRLFPTGIHVYEWKEYPSEKKVKIERTWGWYSK